MNTKKHDVPEELLSGLLANYKKPEDLIGENGLLKQLTKLLVERALDAELTEHLGHERNEAVANPAGNTRNGKSKKTLKGEFGDPLYHSVRRPHLRQLKSEPFTQKFGHALADLHTIFLALPLNLLDALGIGDERVHGFRGVRGAACSQGGGQHQQHHFVHGSSPFIGWGRSPRRRGYPPNQ